MAPIFKEKEENGIYSASLDVITDKGVSINETLSMDLISMKEGETERCIRIGMSFSAIDAHLENFVKTEKFNGINMLQKRFYENVRRH